VISRNLSSLYAPGPKSAQLKYQAGPQTLPEWIALAAGKVPMPIMDALFPLVKTRALMAGVRLGIFEALRDGPADAEGLARILDLDPESLGLLLRVLASSGYLSADGSGGSAYRLSPMARKTLLPGSAMDCRGYVDFNYMQWEFLDGLEELLRSGRGVDFHRTMRDTWAWESYQRGMMEIARLHAPVLAKHVPVRHGARRLLDLAGSHGLLGAAICRRHPPLRSTVLELPQAVAIARSLCHEAGDSDLVAYFPGDVLESDFLGLGAPEAGERLPSADVALLANILHHFSPPQNLDILKRVREALAPSGTVAIWDIERPAEGKAPELGRDATALFFRLTSNSRCFSAADYREWLAAAGFRSIKVVRPLVAPTHILIHARV
jgi:SAM-dependent methyltransferase/DNA-binding transcriptional ArsR family regulator